MKVLGPRITGNSIVHVVQVKRLMIQAPHFCSPCAFLCFIVCGKSLVTDGFPSQRSIDIESASISWCYHVFPGCLSDPPHLMPAYWWRQRHITSGPWQLADQQCIHVRTTSIAALTWSNWIYFEKWKVLICSSCHLSALAIKIAHVVRSFLEKDRDLLSYIALTVFADQLAIQDAKASANRVLIWSSRNIPFWYKRV